MSLPTDITDHPDGRFRRSITADDVEVVFRLVWLPRASAWYADVELADGTVVCQGQRVTPGMDLLPDPLFPGLPGGRWVVRGDRDPYIKSDLGRSMFIEYITAAELATLVAT